MKLTTKYTTPRKIKNISIKKGFVCCGDIHLSNFYPYNDFSTIISSRLKDIAKALNKAGEIANHFNFPLIINGDILMSAMFDYAVEKVFTAFLRKFENTKMIINLGNHDLDGNRSVITPLLKYGKNKNHYICHKPRQIKLKKVRYNVIPFLKLDKTHAILKQMRTDEDFFNVLVIHNQFSNIAYNNKRKAKHGLSQDLPLKYNYDLIVASHIHKFQTICNGHGFYTSSIIPLNFGERNKEHGFHVIDIENYVDYFVIPKAPQFIYLSPEDNFDEIKKKIKGNIICVKISDNNLVEKETIRKKLFKSGAKFVTFKTIKQKKKNISKIILQSENIDDIIINFCELLLEKFPDLSSKKIESSGFNFLEKARKEFSKN